MTTAATPPEDAPHWARPLLERQIAMVGQLAEGGLELAMAAKDQALPADGGVEPAVFEGLTRAYARMARSTRLSLMLQDRLIKDLIAFDKGTVPDADRDNDRYAIEQIVRIIVDPQADAETGERLVREGVERLDRETFEEANLDRSVNAWVATIRQAPGLDPDQPLAREAQAKDEAASGDVGWPLAAGADRSSNPATARPFPRRGSSP
jgi:hypothetical protein